jgi:hypothetical protein
VAAGPSRPADQTLLVPSLPLLPLGGWAATVLSLALKCIYQFAGHLSYVLVIRQAAFVAVALDAYGEFRALLFVAASQISADLRRLRASGPYRSMSILSVSR